MKEKLLQAVREGNAHESARLYGAISEMPGCAAALIYARGAEQARTEALKLYLTPLCKERNVTLGVLTEAGMPELPDAFLPALAQALLPAHTHGRLTARMASF